MFNMCFFFFTNVTFYLFRYLYRLYRGSRREKNKFRLPGIDCHYFVASLFLVALYNTIENIIFVISCIYIYFLIIQIGFNQY